MLTHEMFPKHPLELWIGVVELKPLNRQTYGAAGAFTNIVTWADNPGAFRRKAELVSAAIEMYVADVQGAAVGRENIEMYYDRRE